MTFYTLPGSSGEFSDEAGTIEDTIFGHTFSSTQTGLISWSLNAQAFYKGFAGYVASIKSSGTSTSMTSEAMSLVSGKTYKIASAAKEIFDYNQALTFSDGSGPISAANIDSIDYLFGTVTFVSTFTPTGSVTVTGHYLPMSEVSFSQTE